MRTLPNAVELLANSSYSESKFNFTIWTTTVLLVEGQYIFTYLVYEVLMTFRCPPGGVRHELRPIRMRYFSVVFALENIT